MKFLCPVCYFDKLENPPLKSSYDICPSCGTEFGYDDEEKSYEELRSEWIKNGMKWWNVFQQPPNDWDPLIQLERISQLDLFFEKFDISAKPQNVNTASVQNTIRCQVTNDNLDFLTSSIVNNGYAIA